MPHRSPPDLLVLHAIKVKGLAEPPAIADLTGLDVAAIEPILGDLDRAGHVVRRDGRISGWRLTPAGVESHGAALRQDRLAARADDVLHATYRGFVEWNAAFKGLCTDWQLRPVDGRPVLNDHRDRAYDGAITIRLTMLHGEVVPLLGDLAGAVHRFGRYPARLEVALGRFQAGDGDALARPLSGSYHDVWMELHQDLLLTLDRQRAEADGY